jgi:uncharacterized membrane protein
MTDFKIPKPNIQRIDGRLHLIREVRDDSGNVEHRVVMPLGVEFGLRDLTEIVVGATVLAIPVGYTEEVWVLGEQLSNFHAILIVLVSLLFTAAFTYAVFYRDHFKGYENEFVKRLVSSYLVTLTVAALVLLLVDKLPLFEAPGVAIRRTILVAFPATFSATVVDSLK